MNAHADLLAHARTILPMPIEMHERHFGSDLAQDFETQKLAVCPEVEDEAASRKPLDLPGCDIQKLSWMWPSVASRKSRQRMAGENNLQIGGAS